MNPKKELIKILAEMQDSHEVDRFFTEIFTAREPEALSLRWQLLKELHMGEPQRAIAARHKISLCKIVPVHKWQFPPNSSLLLKFNPRNIEYMPAVKFIERLDLEQNTSFLDRHKITRGSKILKAHNSASLKLLNKFTEERIR